MKIVETDPDREGWKLRIVYRETTDDLQIEQYNIQDSSVYNKNNKRFICLNATELNVLKNFVKKLK